MREHTGSQLVLTPRLPKITPGLLAQAVGTNGVRRGMVSSSGEIRSESGIQLSKYRFWKTQMKKGKRDEAENVSSGCVVMAAWSTVLRRLLKPYLVSTE